MHSADFPLITFFGRAKKVNKETRDASPSRRPHNSPHLFVRTFASTSYSQKYFRQSCKLPACRQVKQARLKTSKNTFTHSRL